MTISRFLDPGKVINQPKLDIELRVAGIPLEGISNISPTQIRLDFLDSATSQQQTTDADAVIAAHDSVAKFGRFSCLTIGARLVAYIRGSQAPFLPSFYRLGVVPPSIGIVTPPTISIGTNAPNYNNVLAATALATLLLTSNLSLRNQMLANTQILIADVAIYANVTIAALATAYTLQVRVEGDYVVNGN